MNASITLSVRLLLNLVSMDVPTLTLVVNAQAVRRLQDGFITGFILKPLRGLKNGKMTVALKKLIKKANCSTGL